MTKGRTDLIIDRLAPIAVVVIPVLVIAKVTIAAIYKKVGHPAATLDDAYIHFQYARAIAEGHPMRYHAGEPITTGATSVLWPAILAPFWAIGFRGDLLVWPAWVLSFAALAGLAWETRAIAEPLAGRACAIAAGAMVLAFSAFTWCAASGMEVVPFAWAIARSVRRGSELAEGNQHRRWEILALAWLVTLLRPEGAVIAIALAIAIAATGKNTRERALAAVAGAAALFPPLFSWITTGAARSTTAQVKLLWGHPYYSGPYFWDEVSRNLRTLFGTLLNGEVWSAEFMPTGIAPLFWLGVVCVVLQGWREKKWWRAGGALLIALMMLIPATYVTFLWNRLRYLWPFMTGWIIGLACLARVIGDLLGQLGSRYRIAAPIAAGACAGAFAQHMSWTIDDVASSASGIARQQATLGKWAKEHLPDGARIGVNDTGAIAYFGDRSTFDIVGLTTQGEGKYWIAGAGSRLEHYERMHRVKPEALPTHFIVYPEWMACDAVLGTSLHQAVVTDSTILGGQIMRVYLADYSLLDSGENPWTEAAKTIDVLDVADLESEAEHRYELLGARDNTQIARTSITPTASTVGGGGGGAGSPPLIADGGRAYRTMDRFRANLEGAARAIVRVESDSAVTLTMSIDGAPIGEKSVDGAFWMEISFDIPMEKAKREALIELRASGWVTTYHYWFVTGPG